MDKEYILTGATGHLGTVLTKRLLETGAKVRALVLPGEECRLPAKVECITGDVTEKGAVSHLFNVTDPASVTFIHCAAKITIASKPDPMVRRVNVTGTANVMSEALRAGIGRVVYVSSVHAIPEKPAGEVITEVSEFSPKAVKGQYAKSKAEAADLVLKYARKGLNVSIVHPSGIIGPGDIYRNNHMIRTIQGMYEGSIPIAVSGGYDFVDSRDVAEGIILCANRGQKGECYILSGHYITIPKLLNMLREMKGKRPVNISLPAGLAGALAPIGEKMGMTFAKKAPIFTPYSIYTLGCNGHFSYKKAHDELGYKPRGLVESVKASL